MASGFGLEVAAAFVPKSVIFSSADASEVPWGVREYATDTDGVTSSPLFRDAVVVAETVAGSAGTVVCKTKTNYNNNNNDGNVRSHIY